MRWIALGLLLLAGCSKDAPIDGCAPGSVPVAGRCLVSCSGASDCLSSERCEASIGACVPRDADAGFPADAAPETDAGPGEDASEPRPDAGFADAMVRDAEPRPDTGPPDVGFADAGTPAMLVVTPAELDFGEVPVGCSRTETVLLQNSGFEPLEISRLSAVSMSNAFSILGARVPITLAAGEIYEVVVEYAPQAPGEHAAPLIIEHDAAANPASVTLSGDGVERGHTDTFQQVRPKIDVVLVIDDSDQMAPFQERLAAAMPQLFGRLGQDAYDFHIGVTSMDHSTSGQGGFFTGMPVFVDNALPMAAEVVANRVLLGDQGSIYPRGFDSARIALTEPRLSNQHAGFLRPDASLLVLFFSNVDDASPVVFDVYYDAITMAKGPGNSSYVAANAITRVNVALPGDDCGLTVSERYQRMASQTGGVTSEICGNDWTDALTILPPTPIEPSDTFLLQSPADPATITVLAGGAPLPRSAFSYDASSQTLEFDTQFVPPYGSSFEVSYQAACAP